MLNKMRSIIAVLSALAIVLQFAPVASEDWKIDWEKLIANVTEFKGTFDASEHTRFYLYTSESAAAQEISVDTDLATTGFNAANPTVWLIHGWMSNGTSPGVTLIKDAYMELGNVNVIMVDWAIGAKTCLYTAAKGRASAVGEEVGGFMQILEQRDQIKLTQTIAIGFSLGANVVGFAGKYLNKRPEASEKIAVIIALDGPDPISALEPVSQRLAKEDGKYVAQLKTSVLGSLIGHANFIAKDGIFQQNCEKTDVSCNHGKSCEYFAKSIPVGISSSKCLWIFCEEKIFGGHPVDTTASGVYSLDMQFL